MILRHVSSNNYTSKKFLLLDFFNSTKEKLFIFPYSIFERYYTILFQEAFSSNPKELIIYRLYRSLVLRMNPTFPSRRGQGSDDLSTKILFIGVKIYHKGCIFVT